MENFFQIVKDYSVIALLIAFATLIVTIMSYNIAKMMNVRKEDRGNLKILDEKK